MNVFLTIGVLLMAFLSGASLVAAAFTWMMAISDWRQHAIGAAVSGAIAIWLAFAHVK